METPFLFKYKPLWINDFELEDDLKLLLFTLIEMNALNILFIGDSGCGKTSLINAIIHEYYGNIDKCNSDNILYINNHNIFFLHLCTFLHLLRSRYYVVRRKCLPRGSAYLNMQWCIQIHSMQKDYNISLMTINPTIPKQATMITIVVVLLLLREKANIGSG